MQNKKSHLKTIEASLILLKEKYGMSGREIAERLGMNENYISGVYNGKRPGSAQLQRALEMLLRLEQLTKNPTSFNWPDDLLGAVVEKRAAMAGMSVEDFAMWCAILYGDKLVDRVATVDLNFATSTEPIDQKFLAGLKKLKAQSLSQSKVRRSRGAGPEKGPQ
jgi:hypothetical protein